MKNLTNFFYSKPPCFVAIRHDGHTYFLCIIDSVCVPFTEELLGITTGGFHRMRHKLFEDVH